MREDAPDVRKEIEVAVPPGDQQQQLPAGIPPSVSYDNSPKASNGGGQRQRGMDPPEAEGVTGYRTAPLHYDGIKSGRGGGGPGRGSQQYSGRGGRGHHSHHQQQPPPQFHGHPLPQGHPLYPSQQGYPPNYYGHPPPMNQYGQPYHGHHHPQQYHPNGSGGYNPQPQFTAPQDKRRKNPDDKMAEADMFAGTANQYMHHAYDAVTGLAHKVVKGHAAIHNRPPPNNIKGSIQNNDFPLTTSIETDFTMSDISQFGDSRNSMAFSMQQSMTPDGVAAMQHSLEPTRIYQGARQQQQQGDGGEHKHSNNSKESDGTAATHKTQESFNMSDLLNSNQSLGFNFGHSGRTRSFPDLMLSTGDLLPPLPAEEGESDKGDGLNNHDLEVTEPLKRTPSGRMMKQQFQRMSSEDSSQQSMTSLTIKGFHPVRRNRADTGAMGSINDAMSIMSLDSKKSTAMNSESSSWIDNFRSMQSVHDGGSLSRTMGDDGSVRSFLSDVSNELHSLDLADPNCLLPPLQLNPNHEFLMGRRPDP